MKRSEGRMLSTHIGSLPQAPALNARLMARAGGAADVDTLAAASKRATSPT